VLRRRVAAAKEAPVSKQLPSGFAKDDIVAALVVKNAHTDTESYVLARLLGSVLSPDGTVFVTDLADPSQKWSVPIERVISWQKQKMHALQVGTLVLAQYRNGNGGKSDDDWSTALYLATVKRDWNAGSKSFVELSYHDEGRKQFKVPRSRLCFFRAKGAVVDEG
jgi:hypothetical protein